MWRLDLAPLQRRIGLLTILMHVWAQSAFGNKVEYRYVYMNSNEACQNTVFPVNKFLMYEVKAAKCPDTETGSFIDCKITFHTEREDGALCLERGDRNTKILDDNAELIIKDGVGNPQEYEIVKVDEFGGWHNAEHCTSSRFLHMHLGQKVPGSEVDIHKVLIYLKVVEISSPARMLFMENAWCFTPPFLLNESTVSVYNRYLRKPLATDRAVEMVQECGIEFRKQTGEERSICIAYVPRGEPDCSVKWTLATMHDWSWQETDHQYRVKCEGPRASEMHGWCAQSTTDLIKVLFHRSEDIVWSNETFPERPKMFQLVVKDFPGGDLEEFLQSIQEELPTTSTSPRPRPRPRPHPTTEPASQPRSGNGRLWILLVGAIVGLVVALALVLLLQGKHRQGHMDTA